VGGTAHLKLKGDFGLHQAFHHHASGNSGVFIQRPWLTLHFNEAIFGSWTFSSLRGDKDMVISRFAFLKDGGLPTVCCSCDCLLQSFCWKRLVVFFLGGFELNFVEF
jgi:hypothetical protein